jgi:hypothetical protein
LCRAPAIHGLANLDLYNIATLKRGICSKPNQN